MAGKETSRKTTRQTRSSSSGRKNTRRSGSKKQQRPLELSLRPEHRRELFALALITIALVTGVFFFTGNTGGIGTVYVLGMMQAFGDGALTVPLMLGALGLAILIQERLHDTPFTGANVVGIALVLGALLAMLEFPYHHIPYTERFGEGGGLVGYWLVEVLDMAIGRPATIVVVTVLMLAGGLLTFNITLHELITSMAAGLNRLWAAVWSGSEQQPARGEQTRQQKAPAKDTKGSREAKDSTAFEAPPQPADADSDVVQTPIAARKTRASLYQRPNVPKQDEQQDNGAQPEHGKQRSTKDKPAATGQTVALPQRSEEQQDTGKDQERRTSASKAPDAAAQAQQKPETRAAPQTAGEAQQELLDALDQPTVYQAWPLPSLDMLELPTEGGISDEERRTRSRLIEETLYSFKVEAQVVGVNTGPAVTQFEVQPAVGVKISKITSLEKDLALSLAAPSIRIEAPIPGKSVVGIEIPNSAISMVNLREVIDSEEFDMSKGKLKLPMGKDVSGNPVVSDMARMPHLLIAGSTGSGKSVGINAFLCGLLLKHTPESLKMILIDPKMVELIVYNRIPHLLSPVVTELERVVPTLKWATREMERRYKIFARHGCRNLDSYKQLAQRRADLEPMPYILIVIDELADLMMMAPDEIETYICRLAQMARATGIHLISATQRPSVDVITGLIKANFPSRIAFAVTSQVDSRVILDTPGADQLLGRGDMLYMAADAAKLVRIQGTYVSDREVEQIVEFWRNAKPPQADEQQPSHQQATYEARNRELARQRAAAQAAQPQQPQAEDRRNDDGRKDGTGAEGTGEPEGAQAQPEPGEPHSKEFAYQPPAAFLNENEQDELLPQALALVKQHQRASASLLQRRLRIGYSKAAQLIDLLEQHGVVGPAEGGRSREVLQQDED
jgi:S-DNA-T family DNA segregation ATPase FtsK/SpoIIIE